MKPLIVVEGPADKRFIEHLCQARIGVHLEANLIVSSGGWNGLAMVAPEVLRNQNQGREILILFDADKDIDQRRKSIRSACRKLGFSGELFLFPDDRSPGDLETLLENCINTKHASILDCFEGYIRCIRKAGKQYFIPQQKVKIYAYATALLGESEKKAHAEHRDYRDPAVWNLDAAALDPLVAFLEKSLGR